MVIRAATRARALRRPVPDARGAGDRLLGHRHRDRHPARAAQGDLRGLPAGRRHDQPEVRWHRARPVDQPGHRRADRRRDPRGERARQGQHVHPLRPPASPVRALLEVDPSRRWRSPRARCRPGRRSTNEVDRSGRVLLVALSDDDLRQQVVELGQASGFRTLASAQPESIVMTARQHRPDGILVGMDLRVDSGESLLRALKHNHELRHIPTVGVLTPDAADDAHEGRLSGALDVIEEPASHRADRGGPAGPERLPRPHHAVAAGRHQQRGRRDVRGRRPLRRRDRRRAARRRPE